MTILERLADLQTDLAHAVLPGHAPQPPQVLLNPRVAVVGDQHQRVDLALIAWFPLIDRRVGELAKAALHARSKRCFLGDLELLNFQSLIARVAKKTGDEAAC